MKSKLQLVAEELESEIADPELLFLFGRRGLFANDRVPRVVVVPGRGSIVGTSEIGKQIVPSTEDTARALFQRNPHCTFHIWGRDRGEAEQILESLLAAMHRSILGSFGDLEEGSESDEEGQGELDRAYAMSLTCVIQFPVPDRVTKTKAIWQLGHDCRFTPIVPVFGAGWKFGDAGLKFGGNSEVE